MTNAEVQQMYADFNRRYFHNSLPKDMVVHYAPLKYCFGLTGIHRGRALYIQLDWELRKSRTHSALTLLHEMVHCEQPNGEHGPKFHKRMLQLAKAGALKKWW